MLDLQILDVLLGTGTIKSALSALIDGSSTLKKDAFQLMITVITMLMMAHAVLVILDMLSEMVSVFQLILSVGL